jgi:transposase InsO family protein
MKFNTAQSMPNMAARQVTRRNQAWAIDNARLDLGNRRPLIMMVVDVHSRLPLSLTVSPAVAGAIAKTLDRLVRRSGPLEDIWIYRDSGLELALRRWAKFHRIGITRGPMPQMKTLAEPILSDLGAFLQHVRFPTRTQLGHGLERWRQRYTAGTPSISNANK